MLSAPRRCRRFRLAAGRLPHVSAWRARNLRREVEGRKKSVIVYVDGFNLYQNHLDQHPEAKWLDLVLLCERLLPGFRIEMVRFFTAEIRALLGTDSRAPSRQQAYLRALDANPRISIHRGRFLPSKRWMARLPITLGADGKVVKVRVRKIEEKQSDVNLAAWMMLDASRGAADVYMLLSGDSDFAGLLRVLGEEMGATVGVISPTDGVTAELLATKPRYIRRIRQGVLADSQLPDVVAGARGGAARRPEAWAKKQGPQP